MSAQKISGRMAYFELLSADEKRQAVCKMASAGWSEYSIASATSLSVEMVRSVIGPKLEAAVTR